MQCNQSFWGNGLTNGPFYSYNNAPLQCNANMYPEIVGEGEVTSMTLPDGTVQFFFMPTVKWWSPHVSPCHSNISSPIYTNTNFNTPHWNNNNLGTWFIRSISNSLPQTPFNPPYQRHEVPTLYNSDYNSTCYGNNNNGYQLKFHNDMGTSTTDLQYFYPSLRQRDYVSKHPCKANAAVQAELVQVENNTVCHYEVLCSKPCYCSPTHKSMSIVSLVEDKSNTKSNSGNTEDCTCDDTRKRRHKQDKEKNLKRNKSKNIICECGSAVKIMTADKSVITYTDIGSSCAPPGGRKTQTCEEENPQSVCKKAGSQNCIKPIPMSEAENVVQKSEIKKAETWHPKTPLSKRAMERTSSKKLIDISDDDIDCNDCSCNSSSDSD